MTVLTCHLSDRCQATSSVRNPLHCRLERSTIVLEGKGSEAKTLLHDRKKDIAAAETTTLSTTTSTTLSTALVGTQTKCKKNQIMPISNSTSSPAYLNEKNNKSMGSLGSLSNLFSRMKSGSKNNFKNGANDDEGGNHNATWGTDSSGKKTKIRRGLLLPDKSKRKSFSKRGSISKLFPKGHASANDMRDENSKGHLNFDAFDKNSEAESVDSLDITMLQGVDENQTAEEAKEEI